MYKIEFKMTEKTLSERRQKYPGYFLKNSWSPYGKYNDVKKRDAAFVKIPDSDEFIFRKVDPDPETVVE